MWFIGIPLFYFSLVGIFRFFNLWNFKTRRGSCASDIMAFQIVAGLCVTYLSCAGVIGRFELFGVDAYQQLVNDPWWGRSLYVENHLLFPMICYQFWNLILCIFCKDLNDPAMIGHHAVTGFLAYFMLAPYAQYQTFFFSGIVEISNLPLTLMDIFKYFPELANAYPTINSLSRNSFGILFIILRLLIWPVLSYSFVKGSIELILNRKSHSNFVIGFFVFSNLFLTGLQFYWGSKILHILLVKKSKSKKNEE
jgi:hypothetical protein